MQIKKRAEEIPRMKIGFMQNKLANYGSGFTAKFQDQISIPRFELSN